jgi:hypothetical protein
MEEADPWPHARRHSGFFPKRIPPGSSASVFDYYATIDEIRCSVSASDFEQFRLLRPKGNGLHQKRRKCFKVLQQLSPPKTGERSL